MAAVRAATGWYTASVRLPYLVLALGATSLLAACAVTGPSASDSSSSSSSVSSVPVIPSGKTGTGAADTVLAQTGAIAERLVTTTGVLEYGLHAAPHTLLIFTNHSCAYCKDFDQTVYPEIKKEFVDTGILRLQMIVLPIQKYPSSVVEAAGVYCAGKQQKGFPLYRSLFNIATHDRAGVVAAAQTAGVKLPEFQECLDDPATRTVLQEQSSLIQSLNVTLVPTMFLNGEQMQGVPKAADVRGWIEAQTSRSR